MGHWGTCPLEFANGQINIERVVDCFDALIPRTVAWR